MKRPSETHLTAMQFESVIVAGGGRQTGLYAIEGVPGVFRRVPKSTAAARPDGHLVAYFGGTEVELVRAKDVEAELSEAGFVHASVDVTGLTPLQRSVLLNGLFAEEGDDGHMEARQDATTGEGADGPPESSEGQDGADTGHGGGVEAAD
jgi:hypothetical protein